MTTFNPSVNPDIGSTENAEFRILEAEFGDGYRLRAGDGLNTLKKNVSLSWSMLTTSEADAIEAFFVTQSGHLPFDYTLPLKSSSEQFICKRWTRSYGSGVTWNITAEFEKVYDL